MAAAAEVLTGKPNRDGALADSRSDALDGAAAYVADCKHPRQAAFNEVRIPAELLPRRCATRVVAEIRTGDDEPVAVELNRFIQPMCVRLRTDQDEQGRRGERLGDRRGEVFNDDALEASGAVHLSHSGAGHDRYRGLP